MARGKYADVLDGIQFERLCSASGPTGGHVCGRPITNEPKNVVFIQCSGSRDPEQHCAYCSKICCMYTAKHATLYKHHVPDGNAYVFYIDIRSGGKGYEEFVQRAMERDGVIYLRGRVSKVYQSKGKLKVHGRRYARRARTSRSTPTWWCWPRPWCRPRARPRSPRR